MLKNTILYFLLILFFASCKTIEYIPNYSEVKVLNPKKEYLLKEKKYTLIMTSGLGCGYCNAAMKALQKFKHSDNLKIVVAEFGNEHTIKRYHARYMDSYLFINPKDASIFSNKFFPIFNLYKGNQLVWGYDGYRETHISKIESIIKE
ncbi:hypothetical protein [Aureivirga marina]|uniref:hypothetical protein n=1 Tax=Aureivirga marina TaxID=1182451 RepID=UPI0018C945FC|nr:hypothetical protein [Aureivirga marina]